MDCLNLGCGYRYHPNWTNVNFTATAPSVITHNLTKGIPFPDNSFDVVYHSHVLEHFSKHHAKFFMRECCRVLKPKGVLRIVVPDLEQIVRLYLIALEKASNGDALWAANYEWILLEMYDQVVRNQPGGELRAYFSRQPIPNEQFIIERFGVEAKNEIERLQKKSFIPKSLFAKQIKPLLKQIYFSANTVKESCLNFLFGKYYSALKIGLFRQNGEIHQWMYDRYSLALLLQECNLDQIVQRTATESYISNWMNFNLDTEPNGTVYKPDSLYMEAIKKV
ncbi:MAG: methyltransferase domain-containing protein [Pleurocapsa sp.]